MKKYISIIILTFLSFYLKAQIYVQKQSSFKLTADGYDDVSAGPYGQLTFGVIYNSGDPNVLSYYNLSYSYDYLIQKNIYPDFYIPNLTTLNFSSFHVGTAQESTQYDQSSGATTSINVVDGNVLTFNIVDYYFSVSNINSSTCSDPINLKNLLIGSGSSVFSGPGVIGDYFYPSSSGTGNFTITATSSSILDGSNLTTMNLDRNVDLTYAKSTLNINVNSIALIPSAPTISASGSTNICSSGSVTLTATGSNITWSNGATGNSITVSMAGTYTATSTNACGTSSVSNSIVVTTGTRPNPPVINLSL